MEVQNIYSVTAEGKDNICRDVRQYIFLVVNKEGVMPTRKVSVIDPETGRRLSIEASLDGEVLFFEDPLSRMIVPLEGFPPVETGVKYVLGVNDPETEWDELSRLVWEAFQTASDEDDWKDEDSRFEDLERAFIEACDPSSGFLPDDFRLDPDEQEFFDSCRGLQLSVLEMPWDLRNELAPWRREPGHEVYYDAEVVAELKRRHETRPDLYKALPLF